MDGAKTPTGVERIAAERQRQIEAEGWTPEHDTEHDACELAMAANSYVYWAVGQVNGECWPDEEPLIPASWPWDMDSWKPAVDPIRNLEKAGALIAAEIDRLRPKGIRVSKEIVVKFRSAEEAGRTDLTRIGILAGLSDDGMSVTVEPDIDGWDGARPEVAAEVLRSGLAAAGVWVDIFDDSGVALATSGGTGW